MTTSMNNTKQIGGAFADALTMVRFLLTPLIMFFIITQWPGIKAAAFISMLFIIAALTDVFDDMTGGAETARRRKLGWFDDIADMVLINGCLIAMLFVVFQPMVTGTVAVPWLFVVPAAIIIGRDILISIIKSRQFRRHGLPETKWGTLRTFLTMAGVLALLAAPWLTNWMGGYIVDGTEDQINLRMDMTFWLVGSVLLALAAVLSLFTAFKLLTDKTAPANDG